MIKQLLNDRYRLDAELGRGDMDEVYRARAGGSQLVRRDGGLWVGADRLPTGRLQAPARLALDLGWIGRCIAAVKRRAGHRVQAGGFMGQ